MLDFDKTCLSSHQSIFESSLNTFEMPPGIHTIWTLDVNEFLPLGYKTFFILNSIK